MNQPNQNSQSYNQPVSQPRNPTIPHPYPHPSNQHQNQQEQNSEHLDLSEQRQNLNSANHNQKQNYNQQQQSRGKQNKNQDEQLNYYNQFCRLHLTNTILTAQLKELSMEKNQLISKLNRIQKRAEELSEGNSGHVDEKKKRVRRSASEIARHYKCQVEGCNKSYGSQGSLNQHLKIKHVELFRTMNTNYLVNNGTVKQSQQEDQSM